MTNTAREVWRLGTVLISCLVVAACTATVSKDYPKGEMTMTQIYNETSGGNAFTANSNEVDITAVRQQLGVETMPSTSYVNYTRNAGNEVNNLFKALPNPQIPVYVYPHLATVNNDELPVPGYTTAFFLYNNNQYAMPTEQY
ncbi:MAG: TIGR03751 family conjugal transfer lipoprotein [Gammaproteobacteria bacterium]